MLLKEKYIAAIPFSFVPLRSIFFIDMADNTGQIPLAGELFFCARDIDPSINALPMRDFECLDLDDLKPLLASGKRKEAGRIALQRLRSSR